MMTYVVLIQYRDNNRLSALIVQAKSQQEAVEVAAAKPTTTKVVAVATASEGSSYPLFAVETTPPVVPTYTVTGYTSEVSV